ncbi:MAG: hypothetical protein F4207_01100 [Gemmatimonadetes bacterium]|nr:hypothetical protein [Gemmatimonadota bacterium]MYG15011.1 hypothetical protein [Gemmatimonadota bacterium]MYH18452.1 hypothetical protein [Gemmatimonadota bacterium]
MIKKLLLVFVVAVVAGVSVMGYYLWKGPDLSSYGHLVEPAISTMPSQRMIVVEVRGDPDHVASEAYEMLYDLYYGVDGVDYWPLPAPRARWPISPDLPREEWIGIYGIPVPDSVEELPEYVHIPGITVSISTWEYGEVVELLYIGPYEDETPSIERLRNFAAEKGYAFAGPHEEEYLKGPGMIFRGNPEEYVTILRYVIKPMMESPDDGTTLEPTGDTDSEPLEGTVVPQ